MKQILFVVSFFSICAFNAQDSSLVHQQFYGKQETAMKILGGWSAINLVSSPFLKTTAIESWPHFHQMNFNWNLLNAGIVGLSHFLVHRDSKREWNLNQLSTKKTKAEKSIIFNMGLDLVYVISGLIMNKNSDVNKDSDNINIGYGNSLMVQGGYLFLYDAIFLRKLKKIKMQPKFN